MNSGISFNDSQVQEHKHSGLGVAAFVISRCVGLLQFILIVTAGVIEAASESGMDENSPEALVLGAGIIGLLLVDVLAIGLGIGGVVQSNRKKIFAVLGIVFAAITIVLTVVLMILGNLM